MGKPGAYLEKGRRTHGMRPPAETVRDFGEMAVTLPLDEQREQASRCMNCGVPFCQSGLEFNGARRATGCPLHNLIPETNDLLYRGRMDEAAARLALTNPFPEFTGRVCPAPCETACNLGLNDAAVTICDNERALSDFAWERGVEPLARPADDAPVVSVIGSGPAGLAAAWELARRGARVRVYERDERPGGLLMFGIPNMKLPKWVVDRRIGLMEASGIEFICGVDAVNRADDICGESEAVVLACGSRVARRMNVPGADLDGVVYAVEYLSEATRSVLDAREPAITAKDKDVAVIGGGDTGVDCVATALRQKARSVRQIIRANRPYASEDRAFSWPGPVNAYGQGYGQREAEEVQGGDPRIWGTDTLGFVNDGSGSVSAVRIGANGANGSIGRSRSASVAEDDPEQCLQAQLVIVAKGFVGPEQPVIDAFAPFDNVYLAGDARLGSTLVSTAMSDALDVAREVAGRIL